MSDDRPALRVIDASASPEEVAAIVAALGTVLGSAAGAPPVATQPESRWVHAARLRSRRTGATRGEWRLSGRIGRRARA